MPGTESVIRSALFDPGHYCDRRFTDHGDTGWPQGKEYEPLHAWQARAVSIALVAHGQYEWAIAGSAMTCEGIPPDDLSAELRQSDLLDSDDLSICRRIVGEWTAVDGEEFDVLLRDAREAATTSMAQQGVAMPERQAVLTPHDHRTHVEGCFRCELGRNEATDGLTDSIHHGPDGDPEKGSA
jgi:hypothetical protein